MKRLTFSERLFLIREALKAHLGLLAISLVFITAGGLLMYIGSIATETKTQWFLYLFGGFFIVFMLFFIGFTMPSSMLYYYEKAQAKKYGSTTTAVITETTEEDHSYRESKKRISQFHYGIQYSFDYSGRSYEGFFYVYHKECYEKMVVGNTIPIRFLKNNPRKSFPRRIKLCNELQLDRKLCSEVKSIDELEC